MLTPYLLVGGQSTRMGRDKAFVPLGNQILLEQALQRLAPFGPVTLLTGDPANEARQQQLATYARIVPDRLPNTGPLGGIEAALHDCQTDWLLVLPIDQPSLPTEALQTLFAETLQTEARAACFTQPTGPEPLPLLLHRSLAPAVTQALTSGDRRLLPTLRRLVGTHLHQSLRQTPAWFHNLNTPADLREAEILSSSPHP